MLLLLCKNMPFSVQINNDLFPEFHFDNTFLGYKNEKW